MKNPGAEELNAFFVKTFNKIMAHEERSLVGQSGGDLSVKEIHVLEAAAFLERDGQNTMTRIAERLSVSVGALTTAVNALVRKGYAERRSKEGDRRIVLVFPSEKGRAALDKHRAFHEAMADSVASGLTPGQLDALIASLKRLGQFFD